MLRNLQLCLSVMLLVACGVNCGGTQQAGQGQPTVELEEPGELAPRVIGYRLNVGDEIWVRVWEQPRQTMSGQAPSGGVEPGGPTGVPSAPGVGWSQPYRLAPYDVATVEVWSLPELEGPRTQLEGEEAGYRLRPGDLLRVGVWGVVELDRLVRVRPDGNFSYDLVGEVKAQGRTVPEIREELRRRLSDYVKDPQVSLAVEDFAPRGVARFDARDCMVRLDGVLTYALVGELQVVGRTLEEVRAEIERRLPEELGRSRVSVELKSMAPERTVKLDEKVVVRPDGMVDLLWVGQVPAAGGTVGELANELQRVLRGAVLNPAVSVTVTQLAAKRVMVLGAVRNQGIFGFTAMLRLSEALAVAGGAIEDANLSQVRVIRATPEGRDVRRVRVDRLLAKGDLSQDLLLEDGDVVFVPNKLVADVNYYVLRMLPFVDLVYTMALTRDVLEAW